MSKIAIIGIITGIFVLVIWSLTFSLLWRDDFSGVGNIGQFGDMFGAVNALFSGLAFTGIIVTIIMQSRELELQRKEISLTREEFSIQNDTLKLQRFENTFFQLMTLHHEIIDKLKYDAIIQAPPKARTVKFEERDVLRQAAKELFNLYSVLDEKIQRRLKKEELSEKEVWGYLKLKYDVFYSRENGYKNVLSHYFKSLYNVFEYVHLSSVSDREKGNYAKIIFAQLSSDELYLVVYHAMFEKRWGNPYWMQLLKVYDGVRHTDFRIIELEYHYHFFLHCLNEVEDPFNSKNAKFIVPNSTKFEM